MNSNLSPLTKDDVMTHAVALMNANGCTTNLDVKLSLRNANFYATQLEVRNFMYELADENNWYVVSNGTFNTYYLQSPISTTDDSDSNTTTTDQSSDSTNGDTKPAPRRRQQHAPKKPRRDKKDNDDDNSSGGFNIPFLGNN